jgi:NADH:ubiquinone oxidoreductase subunit 5 (subunit L)/multisubunit Na+/H+ antiporter MnhA subunit
MADPALYLPLVIIFAGSLSAALFGLPSLNRRLTVTQASWLLALAPLTAFVLLLSRVPSLEEGSVFTWQVAWLSSMGLKLGLYFDSLSALFALLVTFIGTLVVIYTGQYFKGDQSAWRFLSYILLFMGAMLGLVMAGDVLTLFIFWEGTSIVSFLLVAYKYKDEVARQGALKALFITVGGGIALLVGLLFVSQVAGSTEFTTILKSGDALRGSSFYLVMLILVAIGAFTKSAQFPAHIWLPDAMSAPTPASAYLHSATMVKAGIYLMARLNPALGLTESWFWLLTLVGMATMLVGAYQGLKQNDLKALLAYSTVCQLGMLMMMIGQDINIAFKAMVIGVLAHALYKSALFLVVGIVDHETGTRDLRRLGGLRKSMPITFALAAIAGLSMGGLPPLFGFLAKETLLATSAHPSLPESIAWIFCLASVITGALMLVQVGILVWDTFMGEARDKTVHGHEAPKAMLLAPAIPVILSLVVGLLPEPKEEAVFLANAASAAYGDRVKVSTAMWTGLSVPLFLSCIAISMGLVAFIYRQRIRTLQIRFSTNLTLNAVYAWVLEGIDKGSYWATRLQQGRLRIYLVIIIAGTVALAIGFGGLPPLPALSELSWPSLSYTGELVVLRIFALLATVGTALASVLLRRDFNAILAMGISGLGVTVLMVLERAPDVALVQIVVDILAMVILVLALTRLPLEQRLKAQDIRDIAFKQNRARVLRDTLISSAIGAIVMLITLTALHSRPRVSAVTPFYEANAKAMVGSKSIVGAIIVDFRALDTVIEIAVFGMAGLGIYTLLRYAARKFGDPGPQLDELPTPEPWVSRTFGIGAPQTSPFIQAVAYVVLPIALVIGITHMIYGHDQPGDGFTAGVITGLGFSYWYIAFGYHETQKRFTWLQSSSLISAGSLLTIASGTVAAFMGDSFFSNVDFGKILELPLPQGFHLSTSFLFEVGIFLAVLGAITHMLATLAHPGEKDPESTSCLSEIEHEGNNRL